MTLNVQRVDMATVPIGLPANSDRKLAFRGLTSSRLISADIRYGLTSVGSNAEFLTAGRLSTRCSWAEAYTIGARLQDERSDVFVDGRTYSLPRRKGETHLLYLTGENRAAIAEAERALSIIPNCADACGVRGTALVFSGERKAGRASLEKYLRLSPRDPARPIRMAQMAALFYFEEDYHSAAQVARQNGSGIPDRSNCLPLARSFARATRPLCRGSESHR